MKKIIALFGAVLILLALWGCQKGANIPESAEYVAGSLAKDVYTKGEAFSLDGAQLKIKFENGKRKTVSVTADMVGDLSTLTLTVGERTVKATYTAEGVSVSANIPYTVVDPMAEKRAEAASLVDAVEHSHLMGFYMAKAEAARITAHTAIENALTAEEIDGALDAYYDAVLTVQVMALEGWRNEEWNNWDNVLSDRSRVAAFLADAKSLLEARKEQLAAHSEYVQRCTLALERMDEWARYNASSVTPNRVLIGARPHIFEGLRTPLDEIYDAVRGVAYDEERGIYRKATYENLSSFVNAKFAEAVTLFGEETALAMAREYQPFFETASLDLLSLAGEYLPTWQD